MSGKEPGKAVCARYGSVEFVTPGSTIGECGTCKSPVHVSPVTRNLMKSGKIDELICHHCIPEGEHTMTMTEAGRREVERYRPGATSLFDADSQFIMERLPDGSDVVKHTRWRKH